MLQSMRRLGHRQRIPLWHAAEVPFERRSTRYTVVGVVAWIVVVFVWASRPQFDVVATGLDATLSPPQPVSSRVACSNMWSASAMSGKPLPALKAQPKGSPALFYRRQPCARWHRQGRILLFTDIAVMLVLIGGGVVLWRRHANPIAEPL